MSDHAIHHPFSPSRLNHFRDCPGAYHMCLGIIDEESPEAAEGTMLHERVTTGNLDGLTIEQTALVESCIKFYTELTPEGGKVHFEEPLQVHGSDGKILTEGTADIIIECPNELLIMIDWKFGRTPVREVNRNLQLAGYSVGGMQKFKAKAVHAYVFQPRIYAQSDYIFRKPGAIISNIEQVVRTAKSETMILNPHCDSCKYCIGKVRCWAYQAKFNALAVVPVKQFEMLSPERLAELYTTSKKVKSFCDKIEKAMKSYLDANGTCAGYEYKSKPGNREVIDAMRLYIRIKDLVTPAEFNRLCKVSITPLLELLVDKVQAEAETLGKKITKIAAKDYIEREFLGDVVFRGESTKSIVFTDGGEE